ncbi:putative phosphatidylinositol 4-phosphate 5-kinase 11 isoform X1 [Mercurialis annua]|uniref:putative phosphatidylinositol 4-phosphate 5-kinase 11 isoform X1 n=1 Tax=Mercurialis annua TaxID=3986 RepID=UPI00215F8016|nr:putative phosphatidylinositol 4-phosphate 5-kinase 11 isoform X1 [Mercurialis annua]
MAETKDHKNSSDATKDVRCKRVQYHLDESNYHGRITELEWKDYCPDIFRNIQEHERMINSGEYAMLLCSKDILKEVSSPGKPGRLIVLSTDGRFVIKILRKSEMKVILETLQNYCGHVKRNNSSLLLRLYGLHSVRQLGGLKVYFTIFANPIPLDRNIFGVYSLKGSSKGRKVQKYRVDEYIIHKDSDFDFCFYLNPLVRERLLAQIKIDCEFLEAAGIIEYSLLIGLAMQTSYTVDSPSIYSKNSISASSSPAPSSDSDTISSCSSDEFEDSQLSFADACTEPNSPEMRRSCRGMAARAVRTNTTGGESPESFSVMLYFQVVDFYNKFNVYKRIEHLYKSIQFDSKSISAIKPPDYSSRFQDFLEQIFLIEDSVDFATANWNSDQGRKCL